MIIISKIYSLVFKNINRNIMSTDFYFPLYDVLEKSIKTKKKMTISCVETLGSLIEEINISDDTSAKNLIYMLIVIHAIKNNEADSLDLNQKKLPYEGKIDEENRILWRDIHNFPDKLLFILETFIKKHKESGISKNSDS